MLFLIIHYKELKLNYISVQIFYKVAV